MVRVPNMDAPGVITDALTETVDIYPALIELCSLSGTEKMDGNSFAKVLEDPAWSGPEGAISYHRPWKYENNPYASGPWAKSLRTNRYRSTRWTTGINSGNVV